MNSLQKISKEIKEQILRDYLLGMDTKELIKKYKFKNRRNIYYHLEPLTQEEKLLHMQNKVKRSIEKIKN